MVKSIKEDIQLPFQQLSPQRCILGESPLWDESKARIYWVDILQHEIHFINTKEGDHYTLNTGQPVGSVACTKDGQLIGALQDGFAFIDPDFQGMKWINNPEADQPCNRFNDGKCDAMGRFWAGTMHMGGQEGKGSLYMLEAGGTVTKKISDISVSNGMTWSLDHKKFYFIDTPTRTVYAFDFDIYSGNPYNQRTIIRIPDHLGKPDGMTIDTEGKLWIALWDGWGLTRWDPETGLLLIRVRLPVARITSCTFGGKDFRDLYVTSASAGLTADQLEDQPMAGSLFIIPDTPFQGMATNLFGEKHYPG